MDRFRSAAPFGETWMGQRHGDPSPFSCGIEKGPRGRPVLDPPFSTLRSFVLSGPLLQAPAGEIIPDKIKSVNFESATGASLVMLLV